MGAVAVAVEGPVGVGVGGDDVDTGSALAGALLITVGAVVGAAVAEAEQRGVAEWE